MKDARLYIRINAKLKEAAEQRANINGRTLSNYICYLIIEDIKRNYK